MPGAFEVVHHPTPAAFLVAAEEWLLRDEVANNLITGFARALAAAPSLAGEPPYFATLHRGHAIVGCAMRTPPHKLVLTAFDPAAADVLAAAVHGVYPGLDAVIGPEPSVDAFARAWGELASVIVRRGRREMIHVLRRLDPPARLAPGRLRAVEQADAPVLVPWIAGFHRDVGETHFEAADYFAQRHGDLRVWDDGGPASLAGSSGRTRHGVRVNLVYTPPELRGRGYATACVTALSRDLLAQGLDYCCLYTDLANPISNHVYRRIGYRPICPVSDWLLAG